MKFVRLWTGILPKRHFGRADALVDQVLRKGAYERYKYEGRIHRPVVAEFAARKSADPAQSWRGGLE
jgi:hypothetical protein